MWSERAEEYLAADTSHVLMVAEHRPDQAMFEDRAQSRIKLWRRRAYFQHEERTGDAKWATSGGVAILTQSFLQTREVDPHLLQI